MTRTRRFDGDPASVPAARAFATEALAGSPDEVRDTVALLVSEVASNCVRHADSGFEITIIESRDEIRVETTDSGGGEPRMRSPGPTDVDGRGLQIIDMLASAWGFAPLVEGGKMVWFTLDTRVAVPVEG